MTAWAAFLPATLRHDAWIYSWDSAAYVETALSIQAGRGLVHRKIWGLSPSIWEPIGEWPPGYPILMALVQLTGVSALDAGVIVSLVSAGIFVILLVGICLWLFHWTLALPVVLTSVLMPAFLRISTNCLSDASYLAFATSSLFCLLSWSRRSNPSWMWLTVAGAFAGASWGIRNTASALLLASAIFLLCHGFWLQGRHLLKNGMAWVIGVMTGSLPLGIRNLRAFGSITSWSAPPSDLSLPRIAYEALAAILADLAPFVNKRVFAASVLLVTAVACSASWPWSVAGMLRIIQQHKETFLLMLYGMTYITVIVAARAKYWLADFPGGGAARHFVQTYWLIWISLALLGWLALQRSGLTATTSRRIIAGLFLLVALLQVGHLLLWLSGPVEKISVESKIGGEACSLIATETAPHKIVLSMEAYLLRLYCNSSARLIPDRTKGDPRQHFTVNEVRHAGESGFLWGLVIEDIEGVRSGKYYPWIEELIKRPEKFPEFERLQLKSPAFIFRYKQEARIARRRFAVLDRDSACQHPLHFGASLMHLVKIAIDSSTKCTLL